MGSIFLILGLGNFATAFVPPSCRHHPGSVLRAEKYGFEAIRTLDFRLEKLELNAPDILGNFYEPHLKSFSIVPGTVAVSCIEDDALIVKKATH
jgi:hypothetical protein